MDKANWNRAGLAAVILFAPGGFILGATLAARHWRKRHAGKAADPAGPIGTDDRADPAA